jgi:hypothetical protein
MRNEFKSHLETGYYRNGVLAIHKESGEVKNYFDPLRLQVVYFGTLLKSKSGRTWMLETFLPNQTSGST